MPRSNPCPAVMIWRRTRSPPRLFAKRTRPATLGGPRNLARGLQLSTALSRSNKLTMSKTSADDWLARAFRLAYFLHGERNIAVEIVVRATNKLQLAATAQSKRLYYRLTGRAETQRKARSKVTMSEPHLLQRLVFVESEEYERMREQAALIETSEGAR